MDMKQNPKICMITNIGPHYRYPIFEKISKELGCDFYLGDKVYLPIKTFNYKDLSGYKATLTNHFFGKFYWQSNSIKLLFKKYNTYILDGEPYCLSSWVILAISKLLSKHTIAWTHGWYGRESRLKKILKIVFFNLHTKLLVYNEYSIRLMEQEAGISPQKMYCIANSMDSDLEMKVRTKLKDTDIYHNHFNNNYPTIIYCGRIQKWKKLDMILDCMESLNQEGNPINVVFVGKDVDNVGLDIIAKRKRLDKQVWLYGPCYDDMLLGELFYNAYACVSPGNVGLTAIHALSFGCPIITHNNFAYQNPEFEAIIPGITGDFFEMDNAKDLKNKIEMWTQKDVISRNKTRIEAFKEIDRKWNINYQIKIIKETVNDK